MKNTDKMIIIKFMQEKKGNQWKQEKNDTRYV